MNIKVSDVYSFLCELAPLSLQLEFDNAGFLVGNTDDSIKCILLALDITDEVIKEAVELEANLIISHHPVIFHPLKNLTDIPENRKYFSLIQHHISAICMHTNLDIVNGGVSDVLLHSFSATPISRLSNDGCGRIGDLEKTYEFMDFLLICKDILRANGLRYITSGKPVKRIAVMGGSGAYAIRQAYVQGCDTYITADLGYHDFLLAAELGLNLIDGGHFNTEDPVMDMLAEKLRIQFQGIPVLRSKVHKQIIQFI